MKKHILFVDDEQHVLDALRRMLRSQNDIWQMTFVNSAEAAWKRLLEEEFDVMVCDIRMPGTSGLSLLRRIRQTEQTKELPVVMLAGMLQGDIAVTSIPGEGSTFSLTIPAASLAGVVQLSP